MFLGFFVRFCCDLVKQLFIVGGVELVSGRVEGEKRAVGGFNLRPSVN